MEAGTLHRAPPPAAAGGGAATRPGGARTAARTSTWVPLLLVTAIGAALRLVAFDRVRVNPFYDAAVRSMSLSWHNLFYGAFDPGGQVSIDKTPADLWLQVASTKLLGFTSVALRLPEVIAGILAIPLLYDVVRRLFGARAGLLSAAALAVLPISVVTARSDTMDSLMMLLLLATAWLVVRAGETGRALPLAGAGAVLGLAFNVKLFEALIALPALLVLAVLVSDLPGHRRLAHLAGGAVVFVGVALSWLVAVTLGAHRPYPIGSTDGSVWSVVFGYNGLDRLKVPPSAAQTALDPAGITRLFTTTGVLHGRLIGSALIAALALATAVLATAGWRRLHGDPPDPLTAGEARRHRAGTAFLAVWLLVGVVVFSAMGRLHPRYLEAFTPAVAATIGVSLAWLTGRARRDAAARIALGVAVVLAALLAPRVAVLTTPGIATVALLAAVLAATLAVAAGRLRLGRGGSLALAAVAGVAVLAVPAASAVHLVRVASSSSGRPGYAPPHQVAALSRYLKAHQGTARYETASTTVSKAGPLIVRDARPVLMLTSLYDRPLLTAGQLQRLVARGDVKYVLLGRATCRGRRAATCKPVNAWARAHATDVSRAAGQPPQTVYRLSVRAVR
jgi:4-amino-4-deoxy-L-arabinose transferase-like glycosyltransferase